MTEPSPTNQQPPLLTVDEIKALWSQTYNTDGKPDWSHILPYYDTEIYFRDTVQEIHGIDNFRAMTERLTARSQDLKMNVQCAMMNNGICFLEWEMTISFKKYPSSLMYGATRLTFGDNGKIIEQRDYYDLWGDIFDNIPRFNKYYRRFMAKKFG